MCHCQIDTFRCTITTLRTKNCLKSTSAIHAYQKGRNGAARPSYINHCLKSEVSITLHCRLCLTCYTILRIMNRSKNTSTIKVATMKNTNNFCYKVEGSHHMLPPNQHFSLSAKMNGTQRRTVVSPRRMHCTYCGMPKGTSRAQATLNSEKIKPISLAVIKLCLYEGISQLLSQLVTRNSVKKKKI